MGMRVGDSDPLNLLVNDYLIGKSNLIGIEIGSFAGESAEIFLKSNAFKILYCIDPWEPNFDPNDATSRLMSNIENIFDSKFKDNQIIKKIKQTSDNAINLFENESIDFIYIDGCHQYEYVKKDIENYFPKIKHGGIISGHDYEMSGRTFHIRGVKKAVDEYFKKPPLSNYADNSWVYIKE